MSRTTPIAIAVAFAFALVVAGCPGSGACRFNSECGAGRFCSAGSCTSECTTNAQCAALVGVGSTCSGFGQCSRDDGGLRADSGLADAFVQTDAATSTDAGIDAAIGLDAGHDAAGLDAGVDAGPDAGLDAGVDAGSDASRDGGHDAGPSLPGVLNETDTAAEADYCVIQFPTTLTVAAGAVSMSVYGQIYEAGRTDVTVGGPAPGIRAELGYGPAGTDPRTSTAWVFHTVPFNVETGTSGNNDEYFGTLTVPTAGSWLYAYRFSFDGGANVTYCDTDGAGSNGGLSFDLPMLGHATVN
jgi:hypothetical protein